MVEFEKISYSVKEKKKIVKLDLVRSEYFKEEVKIL